MIYSKKHRFDEISNTLVFIVDEKPTLVGMDFDGFLVDVGKEDYLWKF